MNTLKCLTVLLTAWMLATGPALATLTATVSPGYTFSTGETPTTAKLNLLAQPTITISGSVDGSTGLTAGSVTGNLLADSVPDGVSLGWNGSSPRALYVITLGLVDNQGGIIASNNYLRLLVDTNYFQLSTNTIAGASTPPGTNRLTLVAGSLKDTNISASAAIQVSKLSFANTNLTGQTKLLVSDTNDVPVVANFGPGLQLTNASGTNLTVILQSFTSPLYTISTGVIGNQAHGWTNAPQFVRWVLVCQATNASYAVGDEVDVNYFTGNNAPSGLFTGGANSTNVFLIYSGGTPSYPNKLTGATTSTAFGSNWKAKCYARP